jgi:hypothetical protein
MLFPSAMIASATTKLPEAPKGWFDYRYYLLADGTLALLRADRDLNAEYKAWWQRVQSGEHQERMPDVSTAQTRLSVFGPDGESSPISVPMVQHPEIDRLPDGIRVVISSRADAKDANAIILSADGRPTHSFAAGDGIEHVRCAPDGSIWVGYFDEGIFGGTLGSGGIVRFNDAGHPLWAYNDEARSGKSFIDDCYAMTLAGNELWTCFYSDFPITRIEDGKETNWRNSLSGAKALAIDGATVLLAGGYTLEQTRIALVELRDTGAAPLGSYHHLALKDAALIQGQSDTLHIVSGGHWSRVSVADARAALS